jgi:hypothetical protein
MKIFKQFRRPLGTSREIADQEHGPFVSNQLECTGYWATINLTSSHNSTLPEIRKLASQKYAYFRISSSVLLLKGNEGVGEVKKIATRRVGLRVAAWFQLAGTSAGIGAAGCHLVGVGILILESPFEVCASNKAPL